MTKPTAMLWIFDPHHNKVYLEDEKGEHPAGYPTFGTMAVHVDHPERQEGYAFSIEGGWRVTDRHGKKIDDPYVTRRVVSALNHENHTHLPSIIPHGDPLKHHRASEYDPARDADHDMHNELYSGWSNTHDYDPRWDYGDELRPHWQQHPLVQAAQQRLNSHGAVGRVFAADLEPHNAVGMYINGTGSDEPVMLVDPYQHERHAESPQEAAEQMGRTVDHEYRHALQDAEQGPEGPNFDEEDAENWLPG